MSNLNDTFKSFVVKHAPKAIDELVVPDTLKEKLKSLEKQPCNLLLTKGKYRARDAILSLSRCSKIFLLVKAKNGSRGFWYMVYSLWFMEKLPGCQVAW